jgi:hypothetical protein
MLVKRASMLEGRFYTNDGKRLVIDRDDDDRGHSSCSGLQIGSIF